MKLVKLITLSLSLSSIPASASMMASTDCPQQFKGVVEEVESPRNALNSLSRNRVTLNVKNRIKGVVGNKEVIKVLKYGSINMQKGHEYLVHMRNERICLIEEV